MDQCQHGISLSGQESHKNTQIHTTRLVILLEHHSIELANRFEHIHRTDGLSGADVVVVHEADFSGWGSFGPVSRPAWMASAQSIPTCHDGVASHAVDAEDSNDLVGMGCSLLIPLNCATEVNNHKPGEAGSR